MVEKKNDACRIGYQRGGKTFKLQKWTKTIRPADETVCVSDIRVVGQLPYFRS